MTVEIVRITPDNSAVLDAVDDVFDEPIRPDRVAAYVEETNHIMLVAIVGDVVIGQVLGVIHRHPDKPTELYIDDLAVAPDFQRRGIATDLIDDLCQRGRELGCAEVWVATEPDNPAGRALYESLGLEVRMAVIFEGEL